MEQLLTNINDEVQYCTALLFAFMALFCFTLQLPKTELFNTYKAVQKVVGVACSIWAIKVVVVIGLNLRTENILWATSFNLLCYYTVFVMLVTGVIVLLAPQTSPQNKQFLQKRIFSMLFFYLIALSPIFAVNYQKILYCVAIAWFIKELIVLVWRFTAQAKRAVSTLDNYCSDDAKNAVYGMRRGVYVAIGYIFIGFIVSFAPTRLITVYNILGIFGISYTYITIHNYGFYLHWVAKANAERKEVVTNQHYQPYYARTKEGEEKRENNNKKISKSLATWIHKRGFAAKGVTITELARKLGTNRTYLTEYIYVEYGKTFREWIVDLRIEYAKELLTSNQLTINEVANKVGYATTSHFVKVFASLTQQFPNEWREKR